MAAFPAASDKTVTGADENALPPEKTSWRDCLRQLLYQDLRSLGIRALPVLGKSIHERFDKLDPTQRPIVIRVWVIMATFLVLALAIPPFLMVYFIGQQMAQVWVMADSLCFYVFFLLFLCVWRNWRRYSDFLRLSYGLLLIYLPAGMVGPPRTAIFIFVLHLTTVWAAVYLGFSLARHRVGLPKSIERAIDVLPSPSRYSKGMAEELTHSISIGWFVVALLWTALMAPILFGQSMTKALDIVFVLSYMGWTHAAMWRACSAGELMHELPLLFQRQEPIPSLPLLLVACVIASPFFGLLSAVPSVLLQWLLLMVLVSFLGYNISVYLIHL
jgi:hypothetical protein